ncbi:hypothetical protein PBI_BUTTERS_12 [Mycobacterium phage Butters]|uniref:Tail terminator n=2 Tax=Charlievirus butters TaxID=2169798 RepID=A0A2Z5HE76_9CAUD|nr:head-tail adaptor [Mycobacterium phage Butters]AXC38475.1 tail terminator [Mycobacterium phage Rubeelu]WAW19098.1 tail terminator [Mycobacterium phage BIB10]WAW19160.1 tail terminator [Mycobacterium phage BIB9]WAW19222.1 tail terminator [Mycobacterium phage BIB8]WAW19284.1 tail terminator [Mycobacterium phage BIB7]WAW19346.1 tail terminator [Mycobacterium phage BIB6]WAW19408.1 tail terminator [Mycobacterium phage BIB4]WAW19470.1 tail terminator [Mycobacterium phage BIB3]WAW19532.1 tail 
MTAHTETPDDVEEALVAYLGGLRDTAITRRPGDPLPFTLVRHIGGDENPDLGFADPLVSIRTLCDKTLGEEAARDTAAETHSWMLHLAHHQDDIHISGGRVVNFDYVTVVESPRWSQFDDDQVLCKIARYGIGLSYTRT